MIIFFKKLKRGFMLKNNGFRRIAAAELIYIDDARPKSGGPPDASIAVVISNMC